MKNVYDDKEFWVERVRQAKLRNDPFYSVFRSGPVVWSGIINNRISVIREHIDVKESIMDAGCGFGWLASMIPNKKYVGVDQTPALLEYGKELYPNIVLVKSTLQNLPFPDDTFDWVVCSCVKEKIVEAEQHGLIEEGRWSKIEDEFLRVSKAAIIWPNYQHDYEIIRK